MHHKFFQLQVFLCSSFNFCILHASMHVFLPFKLIMLTQLGKSAGLSNLEQIKIATAVQKDAGRNWEISLIN